MITTKQDRSVDMSIGYFHNELKAINFSADFTPEIILSPDAG